MNDAEFWNDLENSQKVMQQIKALKIKIQGFDKVNNDYIDLLEFIDMANEENDSSLVIECRAMNKVFVKEFEQLKMQTLFTGEYDKNGAILTLHSGAGGTEACDWVEMLFRMYSRYADKSDYKMEILDYQAGDEAGIKSVSIEIDGMNAFGNLKGEKGVHRLVRISPFDSSGRRHTSFASCDVMPILDDDVEIEIKTEDLRIDTYRATGAGGQHINTTDSAIRITHIPTNTVVQCQSERSQHKNKDSAMKMLKSKLFELQQQQQKDKLTDIRGEVKDISWGSQIRSYVFHPYSMVKDHRTNEETGNTQSVMDGNIDNFVNAYLKWINKPE